MSDKALRILIHGINFSPELTGIGKYTGEMADWLAAQGHEVRVVTAPPYYPQWRVAEGFANAWSRLCFNPTCRDESRPTREIIIYRCPLWVPTRPSGLKRLFHLASFAVSSFPVMLLQVLWRPDVVWGVEPALMCAPSVLLTARLSGAGAWLHVQDFEVDAAFDLGLVRAPWLKSWVLGFERFLMNRFDKVSTISANMLALLLDKGVPLPRTELFPNWVDTAVIKPLTKDPSANLGFVGRGYRAEWGVSDEAVIALYSGNMGEKQGLEMVVEAARRLTAHNDICFVMCGEGAAYGRLRQMAEGLTNILWMPLQPFERLNELLNAADIHLLPQRASAADLVMPSKLTGIFASGRPVVAAAEPDTAVYEAVKGRGLVVQPDDVDRFFAAILDLAGNTTERQKLGQAARDYAIKNLDKDVILVRFEKALMHL